MTAQAGGASPLLSSTQATHLKSVVARNELRRQLRRTRASLTAQQRHAAAVAVARNLARQAFVKPGARIGVYLALPGELDLTPFIKLAWLRRCQLFVPHISNARRRQMAFHRFTPTHRLNVHRWGMPQLRDDDRSPVTSIALDVVLVPLLGFDAQGNRLGMGAGFYDRYFARLRRIHWRRPRLIGVAYACQQLVTLTPHAHDVRLEQVVTERGVIRTFAR